MGMNFFTFMGNSVAVKLDHHRFFITPQRLEQEFGIMGMNLVTFMSNSVAVRLEIRASSRRSKDWNRS